MLLDKLIELGYVDANVNHWGRQTIAGLISYKQDNQIDCLSNDELCYLVSEIKPANITTDNNFTENIVNELLTQGFFISRGDNRNNIVYIRGCNLDGTQNNRNYCTYNDIRLILIVQHNGYAYIKNCSTCTIDFGKREFKNGDTGKDLFTIITPQQTWAWMMGVNVVGESYQEGLAQIRPVAIYKMTNDGVMTADYKNLGINQYGGSIGKIGKYAAEPLACEGLENHKQFINILKGDARYLVSKNYVFATSFLDGFKCSVLE